MQGNRRRRRFVEDAGGRLTSFRLGRRDYDQIVIGAMPAAANSAGGSEADERAQ